MTNEKIEIRHFAAQRLTFAYSVQGDRVTAHRRNGGKRVAVSPPPED